MSSSLSTPPEESPQTSLNFSADLTRAAFPKRLIVYETRINVWQLCTDENILASIEYLAVSYRQTDFPDKIKLEEKIQDACHFFQLTAYWLDYACTGHTMEEKNKDLYRIADVFRGATKTLIMISGDDDRPLSPGWLRWGDRIWTLPEALLSHELLYKVGSRPIRSVSLRRLANLAYKDRHEEMLLIDGYSGRELLPLLERVKLLHETIWKRTSGPNTKSQDINNMPNVNGVFTGYNGERVYALMGFLPHRIVPDIKETEAAAFERLMIANNLENYKLYRESVSPKSISTESEILSQRDLLRSLPNGHPNKVSEIHKLAYLFWVRWKETANIAYLDQAIIHGEEAACSVPSENPSRSKYHINISTYLTARFQQQNKLADLSLAISYKQDLLDNMSDNETEKVGQLESIALLLWKRWIRSEKSNDWTRAVEYLLSAVRLSSYDHPSKSRFHEYLGSLFHDQYERSGKINSLDQAIVHRRAAVQLTAYNDSLKPKYLGYLGESLLARFEEKAAIGDLDQAISNVKDAAQLSGNAPLEQAKYHHRLCILFHDRYDRLRNIQDLNQAIVDGREAVRLIREDGSEVPANYLKWLSHSLRRRFDKLGKTEDLDEANRYEDVETLASQKTVAEEKGLLKRILRLRKK